MVELTKSICVQPSVKLQNEKMVLRNTILILLQQFSKTNSMQFINRWGCDAYCNQKAFYFKCPNKFDYHSSLYFMVFFISGHTFILNYNVKPCL